MDLPNSVKLYKVHQTGKIGWWSATVKANAQTLNIELHTASASAIGAKAVPHIEVIYGKNIGRSNETSPYDQACMVIQSKANKKIDGGYVREKPEEGAKCTNSLGFTKPQKAKAYKDLTEFHIDKIDWENAFVQRKYDGHRCMVKDKTLYSSGGKPLTNVGHIKYNDGLPLDGELYIHGMRLQDIGKLVKKYRPGETEKLQLIVFDQVDDRAFQHRWDHLNQSLTNFPWRNIVIAPTHRVRNMDQVMLYHKQFLAEGYEGTMLRQGRNGYKGGARCIDIIKIKDMEDREFKIVAVIEGKTKLYRGKQVRQARFACVTDAGRKFTVLAHGTVPEKEVPLLHPHGYTGLPLTVQHFGWTTEGLPNLPVAKCLREDI